MRKKYASSFYSPLGRRLLFAILSISTLISLIVSVIIIYLDYKNGVQAYTKNLTQIEQSYQRSLSYSLWNFDTLQLQAQLKGIMHFPGITYVQIDNDGKTLLTLGDIYQKADQTLLVALEYQNNDTLHFLGNLRIHQSYRLLYETLYKRAIDIVLSQFLVILLISILLLRSLHHIVTRRLGILAKWALGFNLDQLDKELVIDQPNSKADELSYVASAINRMRQTLKDDMQTHQKTLENTERLQKQLALAMENTALGFCRFDVAPNKFHCYSHFASHFSSNEVEIESLRDPMAFILRSIHGEKATIQKERIKQLILGELHRLDDSFCIVHHGKKRILHLSFQTIRYQDNRPLQILICSVDKSEEYFTKELLKKQEEDCQTSINSIKESYQAESQQLFTQISDLRKNLLRLQNHQRPQHLTLLFQLLLKSMQEWQKNQAQEDRILWNDFLHLRLFELHKSVDLIPYTKNYIHKLKDRFPIEITMDSPFSLMLEEDINTIDFFCNQILSDSLVAQCEKITIEMKTAPKSFLTCWHFYGKNSLIVDFNSLSYALAQIIINMRYNGELNFDYQDEQLIVLLDLPFEN